MLAPTQNWAAANIVQENVKLVGLIGVPAIVEENVWASTPFRLRGYSDGLSRWSISRSGESWGRSDVRRGNASSGDNG